MDCRECCGRNSGTLAHDNLETERDTGCCDTSISAASGCFNTSVRSDPKCHTFTHGNALVDS